jgi:hypothetical protein
MTTPWTGYATIVADHRRDLHEAVTPRRRAARPASVRRHRTARQLPTAAPSACA